MSRRRKSTSPPSDHPIRVVVIEPRAILGVGVREILERESDIEVLAQVNTPAEAVLVVDEGSPDVVLVDVDFPQLDATEATRSLHQGAPDSAMVVMGRDDDDASILGAAEVGAVAHVAEGDTAWKSAEESAVHLIDENEMVDSDRVDLDELPENPDDR